MKAVVGLGDVPGGRLEYRDWPDPVPGSADVIVKIAAAGVNGTDLLLRRGVLGQLPAIPGIDAAGVVVELGSGVSDIEIGARVLVNPAITCDRCEYCFSGNHGTCRQRRAIGQGVDGSYAEYLRIPHSNVHLIPDSLSFEEAAAMPVTFFTAWQMLTLRADLRAGESVVVAGSAGGVGSAAVQMAKLLGARVIAAAGSDAKLQAALQWGVDETINYSTQDLGERLLELTQGKGVEVAIDPIGASMWPHYLKGLKAGGRLVTCSFTTGREPQLDILTLLTKQLSVIGAGGSGSKAVVRQVMALVNQGKLRGTVDQVLALQEAERAHELLRDRQVIGKLILRV